MDKELKELMQINEVSENTFLTDMIKDITPIREKRFTDLEIEANKNETFSIVVYKEQNIFMRFLNNIKYCLEKINIIKNVKNFEYEKDQNS